VAGSNAVDLGKYEEFQPLNREVPQPIADNRERRETSFADVNHLRLSLMIL